jgi:hypothetical protein
MRFKDESESTLRPETFYLKTYLSTELGVRNLIQEDVKFASHKPAAELRLSIGRDSGLNLKPMWIPLQELYVPLRGQQVVP